MGNQEQSKASESAKIVEIMRARADGVTNDPLLRLKIQTLLINAYCDGKNSGFNEVMLAHQRPDLVVDDSVAVSDADAADAPAGSR